MHLGKWEHGTRSLFVGAALISVVAAAASSRAFAQTIAALPLPDTRANGDVRTESQRVTVDLHAATLKRAIDEIAEQAGVKITYADEVVAGHTRVTARLDRVRVRDALEIVLRGTALRVTTYGGQLAIVAVPGVRVLNGTIVGKVISAKTKLPIANATVMLDRGTSGVVTGEDGSFRLSASSGTHQVLVRAVGFQRVTTDVTVTDEQSVMVTVSLEPSASVLNEVVVTGSVVATERKAIPNPITVITAEDIEQRGITRVEQLLRGTVPGVTAADAGAQMYDPSTLGAMASSKIYSRGASTLSGGTTPLKTYIDGVELLDPSYLGTIDPKSIERIEVITGPQAATVYGSGAMGGVMQIFTKKGSGRATPDVTLSFKYGMMENSFSSGRAPMHTDALSVAGGSGPEFSYAGNLSYLYSGQWMPDLYNRAGSASIGATHVRGPLTVSGSVSATLGRNGTYNAEGGYTPYNTRRQTNGEWVVRFTLSPSSVEATSSSQTIAFNADYRMLGILQHHLTVGRSQTDFALDPVTPIFSMPSDTLFKIQSSTGKRTTFGYNVTAQPQPFGLLSSTLTLGVNGSLGTQTQVSGCATTATSTSYIACGSTAIAVTRLIDSDSWGGFGSWRIGLQNFYVTLGLRGERNPTYGQNHKVDWTPTNGAAYTFEYGDMTVKILGSYGRATRPPNPDWRLPRISSYNGYDPAQITTRVAAPNLTPEYSRGPQGGVELYYGNIGSITINRYRQTVSDLVQYVPIDSFYITNLSNPTSPLLVRQYQYQNVAKVRQDGWEATGSLTVGVLSLRGTYSWTDSRVLWSRLPDYQRGQTFYDVPSHTGNLTATYARGGTSVSWVTNYMGAMINSLYGYALSDVLFYDPINARLGMYISRKSFGSSIGVRPAYAKSDLTMSHRLNGWVTGLVNVTNITNAYASEAGWYYPSLGRQTQLGVSLRFPRTR